ncbi:MAG: NADH-quinone oxidoreductase subunit C [Acidobacteriota bacterium]
MMTPAQKIPSALSLDAEAAARWGDALRVSPLPPDGLLLACDPALLPDLCAWLAGERHYRFATLVTEEREEGWRLRTLFWGREPLWVHVLVEMPLQHTSLPSISDAVHGADWHERETEDLFGLTFTGHPRLGEFILHEEWPEGVNPMRWSFNARVPYTAREVDPQWRPVRIVQAPGAFAMPVGPIFSDTAQASHFLLETVGEDVARTIPRLFYKYRGVEKLAEGEEPAKVLLMAERFTGTSAIAHAWAFCQAVERIAGADIPPRAQLLRALLAEFERFRHHLAALSDIIHSTGMTVASSQADILEEEALRLAGAWAGHRYLYGQVVPGGMARDWTNEEVQVLAGGVERLAGGLGGLSRRLRFSGSFLDRLEQVGLVSERQARHFGLVGPIARASGVAEDSRMDLPYGPYGSLLKPEIAVEEEGDGYARLRVLIAEALASARLIREGAERLPGGPVRVEVPLRSGEALGWAEAPRGAAFHWVRLDEGGRVARFRLTTPSFTNWHGFHLAAERFAFQDFPIIMATFGLSTAEGDR